MMVNAIENVVQGLRTRRSGRGWCIIYESQRQPPGKEVAFSCLKRDFAVGGQKRER